MIVLDIIRYTLDCNTAAASSLLAGIFNDYADEDIPDAEEPPVPPSSSPTSRQDHVQDDKMDRDSPVPQDNACDDVLGRDSPVHKLRMH